VRCRVFNNALCCMWCSIVQRVAVCCNVLQCVATCCSVLQSVTVYCSVLPCVAVRISVRANSIRVRHACNPRCPKSYLHTPMCVRDKFVRRNVCEMYVISHVPNALQLHHTQLPNLFPTHSQPVKAKLYTLNPNLQPPSSSCRGIALILQNLNPKI